MLARIGRAELEAYVGQLAEMAIEGRKRPTLSDYLDAVAAIRQDLTGRRLAAADLRRFKGYAKSA